MKHRSNLLYPLAIAAGLAFAFVFVPGAIPSLQGSLTPAPMMLRVEDATLSMGVGALDRCAGDIRGEDYQACCVDTFSGTQCCEYARDKGLPPPPACTVPTAFPAESGMGFGM